MRSGQIDTAQVIGFSDPIEEGPRFVFPIFWAENRLHFSLIDDHDMIVAFEEFRLSAVMLPSPSALSAHINQPAIYAFYPGKGDVLTGDRAALVKQIDSMMYLFSSMPFVLRAIHRFAGRDECVEALLEPAEKFLAQYSRFRAAQWALTQKKPATSAPLPARRQLPRRIKDRNAQRSAAWSRSRNEARQAEEQAPDQQSDFSIDDFEDDETLALESKAPRPDLTVNQTMAGSAKAKTNSGFVSVTALIGPRRSSTEYAACKIIASPLENLLWSVPLVPTHMSERPILVIFMQSASRGKLLEEVFRTAIHEGVLAGIYRSIDDDTLPQSEASELFVVLGIDLSSDTVVIESERPGHPFSAISRFFDKETTRAREKAESEKMVADASIKDKTSDATYAAVREAIKRDTPFTPPFQSAGDAHGYPWNKSIN